jgi:hypothetical protein
LAISLIWFALLQEEMNDPEDSFSGTQGDLRKLARFLFYRRDESVGLPKLENAQLLIRSRRESTLFLIKNY